MMATNDKPWKPEDLVSEGASATVYMTQEWFDDSVDSGTFDDSVNASTYCLDCRTIPCQCQIPYSHNYVWPSTLVYERPKITLTLTEVEHLRKLSRADDKLRGAMRKLAPYIEVRVDFPDGEDE